MKKYQNKTSLPVSHPICTAHKYLPPFSGGRTATNRSCVLTLLSSGLIQFNFLSQSLKWPLKRNALRTPTTTAGWSSLQVKLPYILKLQVYWVACYTHVLAETLYTQSSLHNLFYWGFVIMTNVALVSMQTLGSVYL